MPEALKEEGSSETPASKLGIAGVLGGAFFAPAFGAALGLDGCDASSSARRRSRSAFLAAQSGMVSTRAAERAKGAVLVLARVSCTHRAQPLPPRPWTPWFPCPSHPATTSPPRAPRRLRQPLPSCHRPPPPCEPAIVSEPVSVAPQASQHQVRERSKPGRLGIVCLEDEAHSLLTFAAAAFAFCLGCLAWCRLSSSPGPHGRETHGHGRVQALGCVWRSPTSRAGDKREQPRRSLFPSPTDSDPHRLSE